MNIAVLVGVSEYVNETPLPACKFDVERMKALLDATNQFSKVLVITDNTIAIKIKDRLRAFFAEIRGSEIDQAFFYFTGHGTTAHDEVLYCCTDFHPARPATTSLTNSEVDDLLRSVSPPLAVKVLDSCHSGSRYIKDVGEVLEKALNKSKSGFNSFVSMASCHAEQVAFAGPDLSKFTARFIEGALNRDEGDVFYRDVQAHLADAFAEDGLQTPFFVTQGTNLDKFATVTQAMLTLRGNRQQSTPSTLEKAIEQAVLSKDALYVPLNDISKALDNAFGLLSSGKICEALVRVFYARNVTNVGKLNAIPNVKNIAKYAWDNNWEDKYFVKITHQTRHIRKRTDLHQLSVISGGSPYATTSEYRIIKEVIPLSIASTHSLPFEVVRVEYAPLNHPSLDSFALVLGVVHSRKDAAVLSVVLTYIPRDWDSKVLDEKILDTRTDGVLWKDVLGKPDSLWQTGVQLAEGHIASYLRGIANLPDKAATEKSDQSQAQNSPEEADL